MKEKSLLLLTFVFLLSIGIQIRNINQDSTPMDIVFAEQPGDYDLTTTLCVQTSPEGVCGNTVNCCVEGGETSCMSDMCRAHCEWEDECTFSSPPPNPD